MTTLNSLALNKITEFVAELTGVDAQLTSSLVRSQSDSVKKYIANNFLIEAGIQDNTYHINAQKEGGLYYRNSFTSNLKAYTQEYASATLVSPTLVNSVIEKIFPENKSKIRLTPLTDIRDNLVKEVLSEYFTNTELKKGKTTNSDIESRFREEKTSGDSTISRDMSDYIKSKILDKAEIKGYGFDNESFIDKVHRTITNLCNEHEKEAPSKRSLEELLDEKVKKVLCAKDTRGVKA